jgi:hypothetical protein
VRTEEHGHAGAVTIRVVLHPTAAFEHREDPLRRGDVQAGTAGDVAQTERGARDLECLEHVDRALQ